MVELKSELLTFNEIKDNPDVIILIGRICKSMDILPILQVVKLNATQRLKIVFFGSKKPEFWKYQIL